MAIKWPCLETPLREQLRPRRQIKTLKSRNLRNRPRCRLQRLPLDFRRSNPAKWALAIECEQV